MWRGLRGGGEGDSCIARAEVRLFPTPTLACGGPGIPSLGHATLTPRPRHPRSSSSLTRHALGSRPSLPPPSGPGSRTPPSPETVPVRDNSTSCAGTPPQPRSRDPSQAPLTFLTWACSCPLADPPQGQVCVPSVPPQQTHASDVPSSPPLYQPPTVSHLALSPVCTWVCPHVCHDPPCPPSASVHSSFGSHHHSTPPQTKAHSTFIFPRIPAPDS